MIALLLISNTELLKPIELSCSSACHKVSTGFFISAGSFADCSQVESAFGVPLWVHMVPCCHASLFPSRAGGAGVPAGTITLRCEEALSHCMRQRENSSEGRMTVSTIALIRTLIVSITNLERYFVKIGNCH